MTKEERLEMARAKANKLREVSKNNRRGADRMDWKPRAKIYLHPQSEICDRIRVWFPKVIEEKEDKASGKKAGKKVVNVPFNVPADPKQCPFQTLRAKLKDRDDIDPDEIILSVGTGRGKIEICRGEILALDGYDYRKSIRPQADFVVGAILVEDSKKKRPDKLKIEILSGAKSLSGEIRKEMDSEIDENGEEVGNPFFNPYPFVITFDESERGSDMYSARARTQEHPDDEIQELLDGEAPDLSEEIKISDIKEMVTALNEALVFEGLEVTLEELGYVESNAPESKGGDNSKKVSPRTSQRVAREEVAEEEDVQSQLEATEEEVYDEAGEYDPETGEVIGELPEELAEELPAEPVKRSVRVDPKSEPARTAVPPNRAVRPITQSAATRPVAQAPASPARSVAAAAPVKPATQPAKPVTSTRVPPTTTRSESVPTATKKAEPKVEKTLGWEPGPGEEYDMCPCCNQAVPLTATECPHPGCNAKYLPDDSELPF